MRAFVDFWPINFTLYFSKAWFLRLSYSDIRMFFSLLYTAALGLIQELRSTSIMSKGGDMQILRFFFGGRAGDPPLKGRYFLSLFSSIRRSKSSAVSSGNCLFLVFYF